MPSVQPLFLPSPVVEENQLVLANDFGVEPRQFCFGPDGRLLVLSSLFYNFRRYGSNDNRHFTTYLVNAYGPDLSPERIVDFSRFHAAAELDDWLRNDLYNPSLAVTAENVVVLTTNANRTFLFDASLENQIGQFAGTDSKDAQKIYDAGFASRIESGSDGRLVCLVSEPGVRLYYFDPNLLCVSDGSALAPGHRPELTCLGCLEPTLKRNASFPYVWLPNASTAGSGNRPTPSLPEQATQRFRLSLYGSWLGQALPLDEGRILVSIFHKLMRGGTKRCDFVFALVSPAGEITGRLNGIDPDDDSPFVEHHYNVAVDRAHGRIVYKNKTSFFLFDFAGRKVAQVALEGKPLGSLSAMKLGGCSADGRIVLHHPKSSLLLALDPIANPSHLGAALEEGAAFLAGQRARLRKQYQPVGSRWLHPGQVVRH